MLIVRGHFPRRGRTTRARYGLRHDGWNECSVSYFEGLVSIKCPYICVTIFMCVCVPKKINRAMCHNYTYM